MENKNSCSARVHERADKGFGPLSDKIKIGTRIGILWILICVLLTTIMGCMDTEHMTHPGGREDVSAWVGVIDGFNNFDSTEDARTFLSKIEYWKAEAQHLNVSEPDFTIVDKRTDAYRSIYLDAEVPVYVHKDAPAGDHSFTITCYDWRNSPLLYITGTVHVATSKKDAMSKNSVNMMKIGAFLSIIGFIGLYVLRGEEGSLGALICLVLGIVVFIMGVISYALL